MWSPTSTNFSQALIPIRVSMGRLYAASSMMQTSNLLVFRKSRTCSE